MVTEIKGQNVFSFMRNSQLSTMMAGKTCPSAFSPTRHVTVLDLDHCGRCGGGGLSVVLICFSAAVTKYSY